MFLGLDLGTSAVKAVLVDESGGVRASASQSLSVAHPKPLWSDQDPSDWWRAAQGAIEQVLALAIASRSSGPSTSAWPAAPGQEPFGLGPADAYIVDASPNQFADERRSL